MAKKRRPPEHWKAEPEEHDFPAAADYLSLLFPEQVAAELAAGLQTAKNGTRKAKDLLRASRLELLPAGNPDVAKELKRVSRGQLLSPVLLVRGRGGDSVAMIVADGYHRICASYHLDEDVDIPCRLIDLP